MSKLSIPERITLRWELVPGIGKTELRRIGLTAVPGILTAFLYGRLSDSPGAPLGAMVGVLLYFAFCVAAFRQIDGSQSIYDYIILRFWFWRSQQKFYYKRKEVLFLDEESR